MAIANRHIRHDWQTFVDWEQASVKAVCGVKTQPRLAGIPGITEQPSVVNGKYGWCRHCCWKIYREMLTLPEKLDTDATIVKHYNRAYKIIEPVVKERLEKSGIEMQTLGFFGRSRGSNKDGHAISLKTSGVCYLCGQDGGSVTDHITPLAHGGSSEIYNLASVHIDCNVKKRDMTFEEVEENFPLVKWPKCFLDNNFL